MAFQAKDIQEILRIPKIRYEYLARQIGIVPEIEEGEGTGKAHKYSFKNLMQFAIAEGCSLNGLSMKQIRFLMELIYKHAPAKLFEPVTTKLPLDMSNKDGVDFEAWFYGMPGGGIFVWKGKTADMCLYRASKKVPNKDSSGYHFAIDHMEESTAQFNLLKKAIKDEGHVIDRVMNSLGVYVHINPWKIRNTVSALILIRSLIKKS